MRSILLASAAFIVSAGLAVAQTQTAAPAPTSSPNTPTETSPGMSPGNTDPTGSAQGSSGAMSAGSAMSSPSKTAPAPTGALNAPVETQPGTSPGNTKTNTQSSAGAPSSANMASTAKPQSMTHSMHHHPMTLPEDASAGAYLHMASMDIQHHDSAKAEDALSHAETRLLTRSVPQSSAASTDDAPAIASIEHARSEVKSGNFTQAAADTKTAMHQAHDSMVTNASAATP